MAGVAGAGLVVDTGVLLGAADRADPDHAACLAVLTGEAEPLITTALVIAEAAYLIHRQLGAAAEATLYTAIGDGALVVEPLTIGDWTRVRELVLGYADLGLGGTDASLIAVAERLSLHRVATLDQRHFRAVRPAHLPAFTLLP